MDLEKILPEDAKEGDFFQGYALTSGEQAYAFWGWLLEKLMKSTSTLINTCTVNEQQPIKDILIFQKFFAKLFFHQYSNRK